LQKFPETSSQRSEINASPAGRTPSEGGGSFKDESGLLGSSDLPIEESENDPSNEIRRRPDWSSKRTRHDEKVNEIRSEIKKVNLLPKTPTPTRITFRRWQDFRCEFRA